VVRELECTTAKENSTTTIKWVIEERVNNDLLSDFFKLSDQIQGCCRSMELDTLQDGGSKMIEDQFMEMEDTKSFVVDVHD